MWSTVTHVAKKFSAFYKPRSSITVLTASWHYVKPVDSYSNYTLHTETHISIFDLRLRFSDCIFPYVTSIKIVQAIASHAQLTRLHLITLIIFSAKHKLISYGLCNFLHPPITFSLVVQAFGAKPIICCVAGCWVQFPISATYASDN